VIEIPLFPLRSVLCPGVALPLHIFEERYRLMINRCIERGEPFGVVLLREGHEVGPLRGQVAAVGTTAAIRRAGAYPDGRLDILTVGQQRFRLEDVDTVSEPYLVGRVRLLDEPTGPEAEVEVLARQVGRRFLEYLELLQPADDADGPEIEIEFEIDLDEAAEGDTTAEGDTAETLDGLLAASGAETDAQQPAADSGESGRDGDELSTGQRRELLMAAARRLTGTDDPTALSYVLTALIQVDLAARQELLEAPDTVERLTRLDDVLARESWFLKQGLRPVIVDPRPSGSQRG
jgi:Lon protease-like protein